MSKTFSTKVQLEHLKRALESLQEKYDTLKNDKKKEVSQLKKQRRRLKAKMSNLNKKLTSIGVNYTYTKELEEENRQLKTEMEDFKTKTEKEYREKYGNDRTIRLLKEDIEKLQIKLEEQPKEVARRIASSQNFMCRYEEKERLRRFNNGEIYDEKNIPFFSEESFYIRYNPKNGRPLDEFDILILDLNFKYDLYFAYARTELDRFKITNPFSETDYTQEELDAFIYKKGMELLPLYKDYIL